MLVLVELKFVKKIKFTYTYRTLPGEPTQYSKNYAVNSPREVLEQDVLPVPYTINGCTVLICYNNTYYWCPMFEELYKSLGLKIPIEHSLKIHKKRNDNVLVEFTYKKVKYATHEVKEVRVITKKES